MNTIHQQLHLLSANAHGQINGTKPASANGANRALHVVDGLSWLVVGHGELPSLRSSRIGVPAPLASLEPLFSNNHTPRLLITSIGPSWVRINGCRAPRVAMARERDVIQVGNTIPLHVAVFSLPPIGPVPASHIGKECPVCRVPFREGDRCYVCACGACLHCDDDSVKDGMQCAQLLAAAGCPVCRLPIILSASYSYLPEEDSDE